MVIIRLSRKGAKKKPFYHIMVADSREKTSGRGIERIGYFSPLAKDHEISFKCSFDRVDYWLSQGAKLSDRVASLLKQNKYSATQPLLSTAK